MLENFSNNIGDYLTEHFNLSTKDRAYLKFGLELSLILISETLIILFIAYFLGIFWPVLIASLSFLMIRPYAGGIHLPSYSLCLIVTLIEFISIGYIATSITTNVTMTVIIIISVFIYGLYMIYRYAPADTKTIPIDNQELRKRLKRKAFEVLFVWAIIVLLITLIYGKHLELILASSLGVLVQVLSTHPLVFYIVINYLPDHK